MKLSKWLFLIVCAFFWNMPISEFDSSATISLSFRAARAVKERKTSFNDGAYLRKGGMSPTNGGLWRMCDSIAIIVVAAK